MLVYQAGSTEGTLKLAWLDRAGKQLGTAGDAAEMMGIIWE